MARESTNGISHLIFKDLPRESVEMLLDELGPHFCVLRRSENLKRRIHSLNIDNVIYSPLCASYYEGDKIVHNYYHTSPDNTSLIISWTLTKHDAIPLILDLCIAYKWIIKKPEFILSEATITEDPS